MGVHTLSLTIKDLVALPSLNPLTAQGNKQLEENETFYVLPNGAVFLSEKVRR